MAKALATPPPPRVAEAPARRLYSVKEAAALLSVRPPYVYSLAYTGQLETVKLGRRRLIPAEALEAFLAGLKAS